MVSPRTKTATSILPYLLSTLMPSLLVMGDVVAEEEDDVVEEDEPDEPEELEPVELEEDVRFVDGGETEVPPGSSEVEVEEEEEEGREVELEPLVDDVVEFEIVSPEDEVSDEPPEEEEMLSVATEDEALETLVAPSLLMIMLWEEPLSSP
jgi:hypothetical protein